MRLQFKFREHVSPDLRAALIRALDEQGAGRVYPLFPDVDDEELGALYVIDVDDDGTAEELLKVLEGSDAVEFAEREVKRKLL